MTEQVRRGVAGRWIVVSIVVVILVAVAIAGYLLFVPYFEKTRGS